MNHNLGPGASSLTQAATTSTTNCCTSSGPDSQFARARRPSLRKSSWLLGQGSTIWLLITRLRRLWCWMKRRAWLWFRGRRKMRFSSPLLLRMRYSILTWRRPGLVSTSPSNPNPGKRNIENKRLFLKFKERALFWRIYSWILDIDRQHRFRRGRMIKCSLLRRKEKLGSAILKQFTVGSWVNTVGKAIRNQDVLWIRDTLGISRLQFRGIKI